MANLNIPRGLRLYKTVMPNAIQECYFKGGANLFIGDPVKADVSQESTDIKQNIKAGHFAVERFGTPGSDVPAGVMIAPPRFLSPDADRTIQYAVASKAALIQVCIDPMATFIASCDDASITYLKAGLNCNLTMGSGNTATGISACQLDASTVATTNSLDVQIVEILQQPGNALGAYALCVVRFNKHFFDFGRTGVS